MTRSKKSRALKQGVALSALTLSAFGVLTSNIAYAQAVPAAPGPSPSSAPPSDPSQLAEIVVTAQKTPQTIQKTAAAITAVSGQTLVNRGVTNLINLQELVPSIRLQQEAVSTEIYIRGIGSTLDIPNTEPLIAYNIDGAYIPREVSSMDLYDVDHSEVLPGPQGTLYGRGAVGGTINMIMRRPTNSWETDGLVEGGNYGLIHTTITQNAPLSDTLSTRFSLNTLSRDGYLSSNANAVDDIGGRVSLLYKPVSRLSIYLWGQYELKHGRADNIVSKGNFTDPKSQSYAHPDNPWDDRLTGALAGYAPLGSPDAERLHWRSTVLGGEFALQLGEGSTLTYIPSYLHLDWKQHYWLTHDLSQIGEHIDQVTQELRYNLKRGPFQVLAGLYGYRLRTSGQLYIDFPAGDLGPGAPSLWLDSNDVRLNRLEGIASYGQVTYAVRPNLRVTGGARYSYDQRTGAGFAPGVVSGPDPSFIANPMYRSKQTFYHTDWKAEGEYDIARNSMAYVAAQTGFQPGTFAALQNVTAKSSTLTAYTAGVKNRFLDSRLTVNNEFFYYDYKNLLIQAFDASQGVNRLYNAPKVTTYGDQLDAAYSITPDTRISASVGYLHARFTDFTLAGVSYAGNQLQDAPDWTLGLGLHQRWRLPGAAGDIEGDVNSRYESSFWGDFAHSPGIYQTPYTRTDINVTYRPSVGGWTVSLFARNLEGTAVMAAAASGGLSDPGPGAISLEAPRTFGGRFTVHFGG